MRQHLHPLEDPAVQSLLRDIAQFCLFRPDLLRLFDGLEDAR